jgi:hypothetical protein
MNSTSADDVIIQALWPGPDETSALGVPFVMYASRSATRVARSGGAAGAADCACASPAASVMNRATAPMLAITTKRDLTFTICAVSFRVLLRFASKGTGFPLSNADADIRPGWLTCK